MTTNQLDSLKRHSVVVADTGDIDAIAKWRPRDATTNPSLIFKASGDDRYRPLVDENNTKVFKQLGVSPMRVEGEPFDPSLHEAVLREPSEEHPEDVVIEELQRGYHLDGRVLRHALVKVSMGPGPAGRSPADASAPPSEGTSD